MGCDIQTENISFKAFQEKWGKSIGDRAPGMFWICFLAKTIMLGGGVNQLSPRTTKLSQANHNCGKYNNKPLKMRWHDCGLIAQRD